MNDICILIYQPLSWLDADKIDEYRKWVRCNLPKSAYYFPRNNSRKIHFATEEDLSAFTLNFGKVYMVVDPIDMTHIENMITHQTVLDRYMGKYDTKDD